MVKKKSNEPKVWKVIIVKGTQKINIGECKSHKAAINLAVSAENKYFRN